MSGAQGSSLEGQRGAKLASRKRFAVHVALWVWGLGLSAVVMTFSVGHWYTLPVPSATSPQLSAGLASLHAQQPDADWVALHVLYAECRCSRRILDHLLARGARARGREVVLLVGELPEFVAKAVERGFHVQHVQAEELLTDYGVEAAPLLVVGDRSGRVRYVGGYTERKQGLDIQDEQVFAEVERAEVGLLKSLPAFGCGVSQSLQELIDPLRIKYAQKGQE